MPRKSKRTQKKEIQRGGVKFSKILTIDKYMQLYLNSRRISRRNQYNELLVSVRLITLSSMPDDMKSIGFVYEGEPYPDSGAPLSVRNNFTGIIEINLDNIILSENEVVGAQLYNEYNNIYPSIEVKFKEGYEPEGGIFNLYEYGIEHYGEADFEELRLKIPNNTEEVRDALHTDGAHGIYYLLEIIDDPILMDTTRNVSRIAQGAPERQRMRRRDAMTIGTSWGPDSVFLPDTVRNTIYSMI